MSLIKKIGKGLKNGVTTVYKPISAIEKKVRPIGKKIPIVGTFAQLHEDVTEPLERKVLGLKNKPNKSKAETLATIATAKSSVLGAKIKAAGKVPTANAIATVRNNAAKALSAAAKSDPRAKPLLDLTRQATAAAIVTKSKALGLSVAPNVAKALASAAPPGMAAKSGVYIVIKPDGTRIEVPASKVR